MTREEGKLVPDKSRFPNGLTPLSTYMHSLGVKFGLYSDEGTHTCGNYPGSLGFEETDALTFINWGVD